MRRLPRPIRLVLPIFAILLLLPAGSQAQERLGAGMHMMHAPIFTHYGIDELEYLATGDERAVEYDAEMWVGGDFNRVWFKAAGEQATTEDDGDVELQALYSRTVSAFWNAQIGLRLDHRWGDHRNAATRGHLALGFQGLAPYWFEVESFLFVSDEGDVSARLETSYDLLLTQRLVLESEVEADAAIQEVPELGIGSGVNSVEFGSRLRYEFVREVAPYVGWSWSRRVGETADLARAAGEDPAHGAFVVGLHLWW